MCGVLGIWAPNLPAGDLKERVGAGIKSLRYRGPDASGIWLGRESGVCLGHVRLSVIGSEKAAHQPMVARSGDAVLVFNGEVYNYRELYKKYCRNGSATIESDTSVLLSLLIRFGAEALDYVDGMFAFALFDIKHRRFLLARDRFGEKPLYWLEEDQLFAFSSELRGLRAMLPDRDWDLDEKSSAVYHMIGSIPAPRTVFEGVHALEAGHVGVVGESGGLRSRRYWTLGDGPSGERESTPAGAVGKREGTIEALLARAIKSRMVADVPVGLFLSGGIDSTSLLATACSAQCPPDSVLCVDFEELSFSEYAVARKSAEALGVPLVRAPITRREFNAGLPSFFSAMDQPTADGFNTFFLARNARDTGIKVWLSGVGGDELFGGYPSFRRMRYLTHVSRVAQRYSPGSGWTSLGGRSVSPRRSRLAHLTRPGDPRLRAYQVNRTILPPPLVARLLHSAVEHGVESIASLLDEPYPMIPTTADSYQAATLCETAVYMGGQLLRDIDNFAMCSSLELRAPLLDHRLFESVWRLPEARKRSGSRLKPLLTRSVPGGLPEAVSLTEKRGFTFPLERWIKSDLLVGFRELLLSDTSGVHLERKVVHRLWSNWQRGTVHWSVLWLLYSFARWRDAHRC